MISMMVVLVGVIALTCLINLAVIPRFDRRSPQGEVAYEPVSTSRSAR